MNLFKRFSMAFVSLCFVIYPLVNAQEPSVQADSNSIDSMTYEKPLYRKITFHGLASMEGGQIVKGQYGAKGQGVQQYEHLWLTRDFLKLRSLVEVNDRLRIRSGITGKLWFNTFPESQITDPAEIFSQNNDFYFDRAEGIIRFLGNWQKPLLSLSTGLFPFKYNPDVRNLGEYLFRGAISPGYLFTDFDSPYATLSGFNLNSSIPVGTSYINQNLLLTSETQVYPFHDFTLSYLLGVEVGKFLNCGAGVSFWHLISVNENATTPKISTNIMYIDSSTGPKDTVYYTSRGTKLMARLSFDPKPFIPIAWIFGKEDLKIYGEADVIGVKNYKEVYKKIWQRIPITFGFDMPCFRILDVFAIEGEWYGNPYWDADKTLSQYGPLPKPDDPSGSYTSTIDGFAYDNWKWSIYAKKTILGGLSLIGQVARDHMRMSERYPKNYDFEAALEQNSHWWWVAKIQYNF
jgi:hypothetical protein